jgi:type II secretory pathway component PulF
MEAIYMEIRDIYGVVLTLVLVGMLLGVGLIVLGKFEPSATASSSKAGTAINKTIDAISELPNNWLLVIVIVVVGAIVIGLLVRSFGGGGQSR